ncbi:hypothetical protein [Rhodococcus sp. OK302]|uniref:hypothetical protein n=1 Tax=Rhodococcus sp. OK302 TaxID=1882769 RepID=UPI0015962EAB|nr:hypothetical protein [Rhodococcus sp. OK302]
MTDTVRILIVDDDTKVLSSLGPEVPSVRFRHRDRERRGLRGVLGRTQLKRRV